MIVFPNAKINIGLHIVRKRDDGYHDIETGFYPLPFTDALEFVKSDSFSFSQSGTALNIPNEQNLCVKALQLLKNKFPQLPALHIHLHKAIPAGAGLAGGSSDAGFLLKALNEHFKLEISSEELSQLALQLGSDCPFFLYNKPAFAKGRGELLQPLPISLEGYNILLINPGIHISTAWAFAQLKLTEKPSLLEQQLQEPISEWKNKIINDFEVPVFENFSEIADLKDWMYQKGATYASLSGTGSTVYGLFKEALPDTSGLPAAYLVYRAQL
mgnify:CR=1 FL=1